MIGAGGEWGTSPLAANFRSAWAVRMLKEFHQGDSNAFFSRSAIDRAFRDIRADMLVMDEAIPEGVDAMWGFPEERTDTYEKWWMQAVSKPGRPVVPITFTYPKLAMLVMSLQERETGDYYDFATKLFAKKPQVPRASLTKLGRLGDKCYLYGAAIGRSGKLHGQYIVTVRDMDTGSTVVALLTYAIDNNEISETKAAVGLDHYQVEAGLPAPIPTAQSARSGRAIELEE